MLSSAQFAFQPTAKIMGQLKKFYRLTNAERILLIDAGCFLVGIQVALRWVSLKRWGNWLTWRAAKTSRPHDSVNASIQQILWALRAVARLAPRATCLAQSLAALSLLRGAGHAAELKIGTHKDLNGCFSAHAWVEVGDRIVLGALAQNPFIPILLWDGSDWRSPSLAPANH